MYHGIAFTQLLPSSLTGVARRQSCMWLTLHVSRLPQDFLQSLETGTLINLHRLSNKKRQPQSCRAMAPFLQRFDISIYICIYLCKLHLYLTMQNRLPKKAAESLSLEDSSAGLERFKQGWWSWLRQEVKPPEVPFKSIFLWFYDLNNLIEIHRVKHLQNSPKQGESLWF